MRQLPWPMPVSRLVVCAVSADVCVCLCVCLCVSVSVSASVFVCVRACAACVRVSSARCTARAHCSLTRNNLSEEAGKAIGAAMQHTPNLQDLE